MKATAITTGIMGRTQVVAALTLVCAMILCGCGKQATWDGSEVVFVIESNPTNLDARYGQD